MNDRLLKESDVLRAVDNRIKELSLDPQFIQKHGIIDVMGVKKHILAIPSADGPREWIPCSERLPNDWEHVLVCVPRTYTNPISVDWYVDEIGSWANEGDSVIAWMPLPEPYKGEDDE